MGIPYRSRFIIFCFYSFAVLLRCLVFVVLLRRLVFAVLLRFFFWCTGNSDKQSIFDSTEISDLIMVISMLQHWNHRYSSYYRIFKCVGFKPIYYAIKLEDINILQFHSLIVFNGFIWIFLSIYYWFVLMKLLLLSKKNV